MRPVERANLDQQPAANEQPRQLQPTDQNRTGSRHCSSGFHSSICSNSSMLWVNAWHSRHEVSLSSNSVRKSRWRSLSSNDLAPEWQCKHSLNRPGFSRHFRALQSRIGGGYEQSAVHGRVQDRSGQADHRGRAHGARGRQAPWGDE